MSRSSRSRAHVRYPRRPLNPRHDDRVRNLQYAHAAVQVKLFTGGDHRDRNAAVGNFNDAGAAVHDEVIGEDELGGGAGGGEAPDVPRVWDVADVDEVGGREALVGDVEAHVDGLARDVGGASPSKALEYLRGRFTIPYTPKTMNGSSTSNNSVQTFTPMISLAAKTFLE